MLWEIFIDGASKGHSKDKAGIAACAVVIYRNKKEYARYARPLGRRSNNEAEYEALITALLMAASDPQIKDPTIYSDSAVVVNQVKHKWTARNENLKALRLAVELIAEEYRFRIQQVERKYVAVPDHMCNEVLELLSKQKD